MRFVLSIGPCNHKRLDDAYSMAATDDKSQSASQSSKNSDVVFAYCPVCKANYGDYSGKCLCNSDVLEEKEEGKDSGSEKENAKDTRETDYGVCGASVEQCMHREGLQNTFDIKVQNMDTSGDTCLSRSETHSEPCPPINVVLEEQCATDVCEEIGLSTVCAITENVLGRRRKHATLPATELGLCSMNNAQSTRQIASTSSTSLLQEIGSDARLQDEKTKRRTFDVFIVDNEGNMDTYELNKIHSDKGSHIVVNKKECGRRIRHSTAEEPVKSILEDLGVIPTGVNKGPCVYCGDMINQNISMRHYRGNLCMRCSNEMSSNVANAENDPGEKKEPVLSYEKDVPAAPDNAMIMRPIEDPAFMRNEERECVQESSRFGNTIIFEESRGSSEKTSTSKTSKSRVPVRTNGKVAQLIRFYESLSTGEDNRMHLKDSKASNVSKG